MALATVSITSEAFDQNNVKGCMYPIEYLASMDGIVIRELICLLSVGSTSREVCVKDDWHGSSLSTLILNLHTYPVMLLPECSRQHQVLWLGRQT